MAWFNDRINYGFQLEVGQYLNGWYAYSFGCLWYSVHFNNIGIEQQSTMENTSQPSCREWKHIIGNKYVVSAGTV